MRYTGILLATLALALLAGCETLDKRISRNQEYFDSLPVERQAAIRSGRIQKGFSRQEVFLAWGRPHRVRAGEGRGGSRETWMYRSVQVDSHFHYGWGSPFYHHGYYYDFQPHYTYRPVLERYVVFHNGRVSSWESRDLPYRGLQEPIPLQ